jgi:nascent polypeptide-associated complex subunit alpha
MLGGGDMQQMMKQMGIDVEELDADTVEVHVGDRTLVFDSPEISKMKVQGNEVFQLQGDYTEEESESSPDEEDIELVVQKTGCTEQEAEEALEKSEDVASAVMELQ